MAPPEFLCFPRSGPDPHYGLLLTWPGSSASPDAAAPARPLERWLARFDAQLMAINAEYGDKRSSGRLGSVVGLVVGEGGFEVYRRELAQAGVSEDQVKLGVLSRKLDLDALLPVQGAIHARDEL